MQEATKRTILCVEPDPEAAELYTALLGPVYQLTHAATASDALRASNRMAFDAYILEYWLPDWGGASFCRQIRESDPHAPVIFCTGSAKEIDRDRAIRAGASAYLVKPLDPELLSSKLRALLAMAAAESARGRVVAERAVQTELARRLKARREGLATALGGAERAARNKALVAFIESGGARACFERMWAEMLIGGKAATGFREPEASRPYTSEYPKDSLTGSNPAGSAGHERRGEARTGNRGAG